MDDYQLSFTQQPEAGDLEILNRKIFEYAFSEIGPYNYERLLWFVRDASDAVVGGLHGHTGLGWMYIDVLWVDESLRSNGLGTRLVEAAEAEALKRGCHGVYLYTYSFQKPDFYTKLGYEIFGRLDDFPIGDTKYFLKKSLTLTAPHNPSHGCGK